MAGPGAALVLVAAALCMGWVAFSSVYVVFPDMVLLEKCAARGIPADLCTSEHPGFAQAQADQAAFTSVYNLLINVPPALLCAFYAHISDCKGRKLLCIVGSLQGAASFALMALQGLSSHLWVVGVLLATACMSGGIYGNTGILLAAAADVTAEWSATERAKVFSRLEGSIWLGQLIGPSLGGFASNLLGPQHSMAVVATLYLIGLVPVILLSETLPKRNRLAFSWRKANPFGGLLVACRQPVCLVLAGGMIFAQWAISSGVTSWPLYCKREFAWPDGTIGALESAFFAANALGLFVFMPYLAGRLSPKVILLLAGVSGVVMWTLFALAAQGWHVFAVACMGAFNAMMYPIIRTSIVTLLGPQLYGAGLGIMSLVELLCQSGAPSFANTTWRFLEVRNMPDRLTFALPAAELVVALAVFVLVPASRLASERQGPLLVEPQ